MIDILFLLMFCFVYFGVDALHDSNVIKWQQAKNDRERKKYSRNWHALDALEKTLVGGFVIILIFGICLLSIKLIALFLILRWCFFDMMLNVFRGLSPFYVGKTSFLDKLFKINYIQFIAKFILLIGVIYWLLG